MLLASGRQSAPGKDIAGRVVEAAADGNGPAIGTPVVAHVDAGGWAERVAVPLDRLSVLPDAVSAEAAAALPLPGLTALRLLRAAGGVKLRRNGLMLWYGQASLEPARADFFAVQKGPTDVTIRTLNYWTEADRDAEDLARLVDLVATGRLHPEIGELADWTETPRMLASVRDRRVRGNAVLTLPPTAASAA